MVAVQKYRADVDLHHFLITLQKENSEEEMRESEDGLLGQGDAEESEWIVGGKGMGELVVWYEELNG